MRAHDALIKKLDGLLDKDKFMRRVLLDMHETLDDRIFNKGKANEGQNFSQGLTYKSGKTGDYSKSYGNKRLKKLGSSSVDFVNLQFTNDFRKDWTLIITDREYGHGFKRVRPADKKTSKKKKKKPPIHNYDLSLFLEDKYNKDIFKLSQSERKHLSDILGKQLKIELS
jgi:hypothetical protein